MSDKWTDQLVAKGACSDALTWAKGYDSFQAAWDACERGDWMLWWICRSLTAGPMSAERRPLVRMACQCARLALPHAKAGESRPLAAIELAERWANGDETVTRQQLRAAAYATTTAAAAAAAAYAAATAAYAAADAAAAAYAAATAAAAAAAYAAAAAAAYAAAAAAADAYAAAADAYAAARAKTLAQCAVFVRAEYPTPIREQVPA